MRPAHSSKPSYVAKVEKVESDARGGNVKVLTRWYYRPEEPIGGRRQFDGSKEVFLCRVLIRLKKSVQRRLFLLYCKCEMPYNPDDLMVQCDGCANWFHPACIEMTPEEA
ncbi:putative chromatin regulator PHD family [Helianthus annuus]|uniref:Chromatin regulator PHD family n=1 Tax=Helianthus annuus TaxID=4232 RepID=A0A9K3HKK8_HELAN|nr:putative chromatin regulator PHD family [Helianthus annuus]KAJ0500041.1 putative chromatin regulator PHD family [Helianthus annuus]KAJ0515868.1 putative chromatin regulator PHD family [Helianthus annuus]KAJ0687847.1 putative chromatin regulator PHD family [Helianthus annuus]